MTVTTPATPSATPQGATTTPIATATPTATATHWTGAANANHWLDVARSLVPELAARAPQHDRSGEFVHEAMESLREHRVLSMLVPEALGGGGATHAEACAVLATLAHGCPATSLTLSMHLHLVAAQVWRHRRGLPAPLLPKVAADQTVLVSTGASDWIDSNGEVNRIDGGYVVSATKQPASGCLAGDLVVTSARWDAAPDGPQVLHFAVPMHGAGVRIDATWDTMGMRGTGSHTVVLERVLVPDAAVSLVRPAGQWHPVWATVLGAALPLIMATYAGVAEAAASAAAEAASRRAGRTPVCLVGRMGNQLTCTRDTVRAMIDASADLTFDNTIDHACASLTRKTIAARAAIETTRLALEVAGGAGFATATGIERLFRDAHGALYHPLPEASQEEFTGRVALGLDPLGR